MDKGKEETGDEASTGAGAATTDVNGSIIQEECVEEAPLGVP